MMAKRSKLLAALDVHRGRDYQVEKQKELQKRAKRKKTRDTTLAPGTLSETISGQNNNAHLGNKSDGWETDKSDNRNNLSNTIATSQGELKHQSKEQYTKVKHVPILDLNSDEDGETHSEPEEIPLSDLETFSEDEEGDVIPHQRLTINNISALIKAWKSIAIPLSNVPFSEHQSVTSAAQISILNVNDDLDRELAFYKQCLDATNEARTLLKTERVAFTRPVDYFAEMVKTDEHMGKIKQKMTDEAANKLAAAEARKQRDLKNFGKQVQVAKQQERDKSKRETLEKINILKRKRRNTENVNTQEEDLFDVALEDTNSTDRQRTVAKSGIGARMQNKKQKRDAKFGFGGKKRFSKSGDALSSGDLKGFSTKKMKGQKTGALRLGKSRRAKRS